MVTILLALMFSLHGHAALAQEGETEMNAETELAGRFAALALDCVHREYPNKIAHVFNSDADVGTPSQLYPVFYGCFDWHSSVHGHWLLVRLLHLAPDIGLPAELQQRIRETLEKSFRPESVTTEVAYLQAENRQSFERPYGLAWFLQLTAELREWDSPLAQTWLEILLPLEQAVVAQVKSWLPNLAYAIRVGTHNQSMFAFGLMLDWAVLAGDEEMQRLITDKSMEFHMGDTDCPIQYEPSGEDFLSPCLMEADLMRRILDQEAFSGWLTRFLPAIPRDGSGDWLAPGVVMDPTDGKLVHLDGVNLSRAWNLENIAAALPPDDARRSALLASAEVHATAGIASVSDEHYSGSHWLASFATYLITRRGQPAREAPSTTQD